MSVKRNKVSAGVVALVVVAGMATGGTSSAAAVPLAASVSSTAPAQAPAESAQAGTTAIPLSTILAKGYTEQEVRDALKGNPYVTLETVPSPSKAGHMGTQGVTFGRFIYVRISQAQAKAINAGSAAAAIGIIGLATGGIGGVIAAVVYTYIASLNDSALNRCARWEFRLTYPLPFSGSRVVGAKCI